MKQNRVVSRNASDSRERLLRAGEKLFAERGADATSVERLSREAGLNRRMIYHYFGSKEGLYRAVIQRMYDRSASIEVPLAHMLLPADQLLERIIRAYYAFLRDHPEFVRLLAWENLRQGRAARDIGIAETKAPILEALRLALQAGIREGRFRRDVDERQLLISCMGLSFFYFSNRHTLGRLLGFDLMSKAAVERRMSHVVNLLLDGIRAKAPRRSRRTKGERS